MIQPSTLDFLKQLAKNNNKDWFTAHKKTYETAQLDFEATVQAIIDGVAKFDPALKGLEARKVIFRIYRDVRFAKDKSPYKTNMGASFSASGKGLTTAGYYLHLEPGGKSMIGGGMYMPEAKTLGAIRQEVDYNTKEFKTILNNKKFKDCYGELEDLKLKTSPKGYPKDHPNLELLKYTSYVTMHPFKDKEVTSKDFVKNAIDCCKALKPLNDFLNKAIS